MVSFGTSGLKAELGAGSVPAPSSTCRPFGPAALRVSGGTLRSLLLVYDLIVRVNHVILRGRLRLGPR